MNYNITEKAMLASLHISCWSARKHDKRVSKEVDDIYGGKDAGRFNKVLAQKEALKEIQTIMGSARTFHLEQTLPLPLQIEPKGGGGTDFRPVFEWVENQGVNPCCLIYLTDLECNRFPAHAPAYSVLWIQTGNSGYRVPFGEIVQMK